MIIAIVVATVVLVVIVVIVVTTWICFRTADGKCNTLQNELYWHMQWHSMKWEYLPKTLKNKSQ